MAPVSWRDVDDIRSIACPRGENRRKGDSEESRGQGGEGGIDGASLPRNGVGLKPYLLSGPARGPRGGDLLKGRPEVGAPPDSWKRELHISVISPQSDPQPDVRGAEASPPSSSQNSGNNSVCFAMSPFARICCPVTRSRSLMLAAGFSMPCLNRRGIGTLRIKSANLARLRNE